MGKVTIVGSFVQDHAWIVPTFPRIGETTIATAFATGVGGKGFNQAVAAQRLGATTRFVGALGDDALGESAQRWASSQQLDCAWEVLPTYPTAASSIVVDSTGRNLICVALGANGGLSAAFVRSALANSAPSEVVLAQLEVNLDATREALTAARREGALSLLNPAPLHPALDRDLLALADIITPNETEFQTLLRQLFKVELAADFFTHSDAELHAWCRLTGVATVVITLGDQGAFVSHDDDYKRGDARAFYRVEAIRVNTIDTTGAGDAFSGALANALAAGTDQSFREMVEFASRCAAFSTETVGTAPAMPTLDQVIARFP